MVSKVLSNLKKGIEMSEFLKVLIVVVIFLSYLATLAYGVRLSIFMQNKNKDSNKKIKLKMLKNSKSKKR